MDRGGHTREGLDWILLARYEWAYGLYPVLS